jgi:hypothetical protein
MSNMEVDVIQSSGSIGFSRLVRRSVLSLILLEVFLGGGGRLIDIGTLSIRMYIFLFAICLGALFLSARPILKAHVLTILISGTLVISLGTIIGFVQNHDPRLIFEDVKPLLFLYSLLFMPFLIKDLSDVELIVRLLKISAIILALSYLVILGLIHTKIIPFKPFHNWSYRTQELFFRGEFAFFYKGFFFMCVGIFFYRWKGFWSKAAILVILAAIILTFTRGFIVTFLIVAVIYLFFIRKRLLYLLLFALFTVIAVPVIWGFVSNEEMIDRQTSNTNRIVQITEVVKEITPASALIGHGFGKNIESREDLHLEIAYLEIFHKQGVVGLLFWLYLFYVIFREYKKAVKVHSDKAIPFYLAVLFAYIQSLTNPFINNPLGITLLVIALLCLHILQSEKFNPDQMKFRHDLS